MTLRLAATIAVLALLKGCEGSSGTSVTSAPLSVGDAHCPFGGSAFTSANATTYACSAPAYVGSAGVLVTGNTLSIDTAFGDARWKRAAVDAGGPRVKSISVDAVNTALIHVVLTSPPLTATVAASAFSVTATDLVNPWASLALSSVSATTIGSDPAIDLTLTAPQVPGTILRIIAKGTGPTPLLGTNTIPLAGLDGGNATDAFDGADAVVMMVSP